MTELIQLLFAFAGSAGFALAYRFRGRMHVFLAGLGGCGGWLVYLLALHASQNPYLAGFLGTVAVSLFSSLAARLVKAPATGFLITTSIPMIPGASLYRTMQYLLLSDPQSFRSEGTYTLLFACSMAAGFVSAAMLTYLLQMLISSPGEAR